MRQTTQTLRMLGAAALSLAGALCWPTAAQAQTASGNANHGVRRCELSALRSSRSTTFMSTGTRNGQA